MVFRKKGVRVRSNKDIKITMLIIYQHGYFSLPNDSPHSIVVHIEDCKSVSYPY